MDRKNSSSSSLKHSASDDALKKKETQEAVDQIIQHLKSAHNERQEPKFRILHSNVNSIKCNARYEEIKRLLQTNKLDMVLVNETKLINEDFSEPFLAANYNMIRRDRFFPKPNKKVRGGGVLVYVKKSHSIVDIYRDQGALELIYVKLNAGQAPLNVVCVYKPPDVSKTAFERHFSSFMSKFDNFSGELVAVIGDLNIDKLGNVEVNQIDFKNVVKQPTHKNHSIDAVLLANTQEPPESLVDIDIFEEIGDHKCVLASFNLSQGETVLRTHFTYKTFRSVFDCHLDAGKIVNVVPSENRMRFSDLEPWLEFKLELTDNDLDLDELDEQLDKLAIS